MKVIEPYVILEDEIDGSEIIKKIEKIGRVCYKSENNITDDSAERFIKNIIKNGHESVLEHVSITLRVICDRGVTHELVRHRIASYSQESTRYCNYSNDKFGNELTFIKPCFWENRYNTDECEMSIGFECRNEYEQWLKCMASIEQCYFAMLEHGATPEQVRSIFPNSLKTEIVMTMNLREWRHFLKLRTSNKAHPQMREVALITLNLLKDKIPVVFDDIKEE